MGRAQVAVSDRPLSLDEAVEAVRDPKVGGIVTFVGVVRDHDDGRAVTELGYTAHPSAHVLLEQVANEAAQHAGVHGVSVTHRTGDLAIGDAAVVLAVGAEHRGEAFAAARYLIDELKKRVPIWKNQRFADGGDEWVGTP